MKKCKAPYIYYHIRRQTGPELFCIPPMPFITCNKTYSLFLEREARFLIIICEWWFQNLNVDTKNYSMAIRKIILISIQNVLYILYKKSVLVLGIIFHHFVSVNVVTNLQAYRRILLFWKTFYVATNNW